MARHPVDRFGGLRGTTTIRCFPKHITSDAKMDEPSQTTPASDEEVLAYMQRQLRSGRVKPAVLIPLTQKAFTEVSHERIVQCFNQLDSALFKR